MTEQTELDMTTFLNLMVVLVPFLLITAVFSRITVVELSLPTTAGGPASDEPVVRVEVVVREDRLEVAENEAVIAKIPKVDGAYDLANLSEKVMELKRQYPTHNAASVLLEPSIEYDHLIQVMDVVRSAEIPLEEGEEAAPDGPSEFRRLALFSDISVGDAP